MKNVEENLSKKVIYIIILIPCIKIEKQNDNKNIRKELEKIKSENILIKSENDQLKKEIVELKNMKDSVINDVNINITNNFNIITLIDHGKEDYNKLNIKKIMLENQILPKLNYIFTILYYVHCNEEYPEYQNIYISDMNRNKVMIYHNGTWISTDKVSTMDNLFNSIVKHIDIVMEESNNKDDFLNYITEIKRVNPFGKLYTTKNKKIAMSNSENVLYNNKEKIKTIKTIKPRSTIIKQIVMNTE